MPIEKEIITTENIIIDCKKEIFKTCKSAVFLTPLALLLSICLIPTLISLDNLEIKIIILLILPFPLLFLAASIHTLPIEYKKYKSITQQKFEVKTDKLVHKINEVRSPFGEALNKHERPCTLQFSQYGDFNIFDGTFYPSSKHYKMHYDELFRSSKIGDEFYLVIDNKNKILMAYNTKFFEFQE